MPSTKQLLFLREAALNQVDVVVQWCSGWIALSAVHFIVMGWRNVIKFRYTHTHRWFVGIQTPVEYVFRQPQAVLIVHFVSGMLFLITCLVQWCTISVISYEKLLDRRRISGKLEPSAEARYSYFAMFHRWLGRFCVAFGIISALAALPMCFSALYNTVLFYLPWTLVWLLTSCRVWQTARNGQFSQHRRWANLLVQISLLFVTARIVIIGLRLIGCHQVSAYRWGVFSSGLIAKCWLAYRWFLERQPYPSKMLRMKRALNSAGQEECLGNTKQIKEPFSVF